MASSRRKSLKVLVTGASGFIGGYLVKELIKQGYSVRGLARNPSKTIDILKMGTEVRIGDIKDRDYLERAVKGVDYIVHLAASTSETNISYKEGYETNVVATRNLLTLAQVYRIKRFITLSSESTKRKIKGTYAKTKHLADLEVKKSELDYIILRPSLVYGAGGKGVFHKFSAIIEGLPIVPIVGDGKITMKPVYVKDVVESIIKSIKIKNPCHKEYDITGPETMTFNSFVRRIMKAKGNVKPTVHIPFWFVFFVIKSLSTIMKNPLITVDNMLGYKQVVYMDGSIAKNELGLKGTRFAEGMADLFAEEKVDFLHDVKKIVKVAIVGMGKMGMLHASLINSMQDAKVVAVCDANKAIRNQVISTGISNQFYDDVDVMLKNSTINAAILCLPPNISYVVSKKFLDKGIHVMVEKPMANNLANSKRMVEAIKRTRLITGVGYMVMHDKMFLRYGELLKSGVIKKVKLVKASIYLSRIFSKGKTWHYDRRKSGGGVVITMGSHVLMLLISMFGKIKKVTAIGLKKYNDVEDIANIQLEFQSGVKGILDASWSIKGYKNLYIEIDAKGKNSSMFVNNNQITLWDKKGKKLKKTKYLDVDIKKNEEFLIGGRGYYLQDRKFIDSVKNGKKFTPDWNDAFEVQKVLHAIYESIEKSKPVIVK